MDNETDQEITADVAEGAWQALLMYAAKFAEEGKDSREYVLDRLISSYARSPTMENCSEKRLEAFNECANEMREVFARMRSIALSVGEG